MGKVYDRLEPKLVEFIAKQKMFFVATAPRADDGLINLSPKGLDTLRVLDERRIAYLDLTGSGIETIAHIRENGRLVMMFCAFDGAPKILRLYGRGVVHEADSPTFAELRPSFPDLPGARAIIVLNVTRTADSCGYSVPRYDYVGDRDTLQRWTTSKGPEGLEIYRAEKNRLSLDGLQGLASAKGDSE